MLRRLADGPRGRDRPRPPRQRHQRAAADAARGDDAELRPRQPRASREPGARGRRRRARRRGGVAALDVDTADDLEVLAHGLAGAPRERAMHTRNAMNSWRRRDDGVEVIAIEGLPEIARGDDLAAILAAGAQAAGGLGDGDVLVVAHKIVSKAEGARRGSRRRRGRPRGARFLADEHGKDPRAVQVVLDESAAILRAERGVLICRTRHGFVCANAGVDASNAGAEDRVVTLPRDPDASARALRARCPARPAVVIADSFGRAWRHGQCDVAIGIAGLAPLDDWRGRADADGHELHATWIADRRRGRGRGRSRARQGLARAGSDRARAGAPRHRPRTAPARRRSFARRPRTSSAEPAAARAARIGPVDQVSTPRNRFGPDEPPRGQKRSDPARHRRSAALRPRAIGPHREPYDTIAADWIYSLVEFAGAALIFAWVLSDRDKRWPWAAIGAGMLLWSIGDLLWTVWLDKLESPPYPSFVDAVYFASYAALYCGIFGLSRTRHSSWHEWIDGLIAA